MARQAARRVAGFVTAGLGHDDIVNNVRLMISGGINEPRRVGLAMQVLLTMPEVTAAVRRDPSVLRTVVEETFRFHSLSRTASTAALGSGSAVSKCGSASLRRSSCMSVDRHPFLAGETAPES